MTTPKPRVLVVDDEILTLKAMQRILRDYEVTVASSGREALSLLAQHGSFDVVLCDVMMPDINGVDVYRQISAQRPGQEERIVFLSGGVYGLDLIEFLETIPNALITKPFDQAELVAKVAEVASR